MIAQCPKCEQVHDLNPLKGCPGRAHTITIPCPDGKEHCETLHTAAADTIDGLIADHADKCNVCVQGENCSTRNMLFAKRAELKHGRIVGKTNRLTARIQYKARGSQLVLELDGQHAGILEQADGLELEKALNRWLHSED